MDKARHAALRLLCEITEDGRLMSEAAGPALAPLAPADRARAGRLATTALRWRDRSDRMLGPYLRMKPRTEAMNALRLALAEVYVDGAAPHGAVGAAVDLVRASEAAAGQAGLVNAVLRKATAEGLAAWDALPIPRLPKWLRKPLVADYGKDRVAAMEAAFSATPPLDLTAKADPAGWAGRLGAEVLPTGSLRLAGAGQVSALPGYAEGAWWVQDAAAAIPVRALNPQPGERILDMCAAPGGKTLQLAAAGAEVTAIDASEARMTRLTENLARCGLRAQTVVGDALTHEGSYDAILLDAPCSGTGTIRRHPDLPVAKTGEDFPALFRLQERMIDAALSLVRLGGRVVFCTCSLLIDEGEEQVRDALQRHPGLSLRRGDLHLPGIAPDWIGPEGLRLTPDLWPDLGGMDGFFVAVLGRPL